MSYVPGIHFVSSGLVYNLDKSLLGDFYLYLTLKTCHSIMFVIILMKLGSMSLVSTCCKREAYLLVQVECFSNGRKSLPSFVFFVFLINMPFCLFLLKKKCHSALA